MTPRLAERVWRFGLGALAVLALVSPPQSALAQHGPSHRVKFDRHLLDRVERQEAGDEPDATVRVIVKMRPGARQGLRQKLLARGGRLTQDFSVIDASTAELTLKQLDRLAGDKDVESVSVDAPVFADGVASTTTGTAQGSGFSLRGTLGLRGVSATAATLSFQQGNAAGYTGVVDTGVDYAAASTAYGSASSVYVEGVGVYPAAMLVRFDNLFGAGTGQIPPGSTITSVSLRVNQLVAGSSAATLSVYRMLQPWDVSKTYNSMSTSGAGLQFDNVEVASAADASVANMSLAGLKTFSSAALTATVQGWANGLPNHGWVVFQNTSSYVRTSTSEDATLANRPLLTVTYKAPVNTTTLTGNGVTVAVIDSGVLEDGGTTTRIKTTRDFTTGSANPPHIAPVDGYGHGTHVAGLIGGNKTEVEGVAPGVKFVSLKVLNSLGAGSTSSVINALQWAVANRTAYGIDVINLSLGHPIYERASTDPLVQAVESAVRAGITVVVAAGNAGISPYTGQPAYTGISSPANAPSAITVGSSRTLNTTSRQDDLVSDFSSRGPTWFDAFEKPDLVAPGQYLLGPAVTTQNLYLSLPVLHGPSYGGRAYVYLSGTSMAAGVASGSVALMIEQARLHFAGARPTSNAVKAMLQRSAIPLANAAGARYDRLTQGAGELNAYGATRLAAALNPNATAGWNWVTSSFNPTTTIDGQVLGWNDNVVWGTKVLWGGALDTKLNAWNDNVVWGTNDNVVWGTSLPGYTVEDNIVWGTSAVWTDNVVWGTNDNIVWGTNDDNVVWGTRDDVVWGTNDNVVWGTDDNVVWGTNDDNVVWGTSALVTPIP